MTALAAAIGPDGARAKQLVDAMLTSLRALGPEGRRDARLGSATFGIAISHHLPEDRFDRQPRRLPGGRRMALVDGRLDNRAEIAAALGRAGQQDTSDSDLIGAMWDARGAAGAGAILGDWCLVLWDEDARRLILARSPLGTRALFYASHEGFLLIASLPQALLAAGVRAELDRDHVADLMSQADHDGEHTIFRGVRRVPPGFMLVLDPEGRERSRQRLWHQVVAEMPRDIRERAALFRETAVAAVEARMRRASGGIACQLSAGRDSGLVTALAAQIEGRAVTALTAAPRAGFHDAGLPHHLQDESEAAAGLAGSCGIAHQVLRPADHDGDLLATIRRLHRFSDDPILNVANLRWWDALGRAAAAAGCRVLLTGQLGNFTVSMGGVSALGDYLAEEGLMRWGRIAGPLASAPELGPITVLHQSFGSYLPTGLVDRIRRWRRPMARTVNDLPLLSKDLRNLANRRRSLARDRAPRGYRASVADWLQRVDMGDRILMGAYGIELRDPTGDRRLADFALALPVRDMVDADCGRPLFEMAFGDLFPPTALKLRKRGQQSADWMEQFKPEEIRGAFEEAFSHPLARELLDPDAIERTIDDWPEVPTNQIKRSLYRGALLEALGLALFVKDHF